MKKKFSKILGVGLTLVLVFALTAGFALPVGASPDENEWSTFDYPAEGDDGGWFYDPDITGITAIDQAINGDLYAYVNGGATVDDMFLSTDGGRSWSQTDYRADLTGEGDVIDIACSSLDEEIVYVTDGALVYKTEDAGDTWAKVAGTSLTNALSALPGGAQTITSLAVGYDRNDDPLVFVGSEETGAGCNGGVLYIAEESYPSVWTDLDFDAYGVKTYDVVSIAVSPEFASDDMLLAVVSFEALPIGNAGWSTEEKHSGNYSAKLIFVNAHVCVDFTPVAGTTIADLAAASPADFGFWYFQEEQAGFGPQLELKFEDPDTADFVDVTFMLQTNTVLNTWTEVDLGSTFGNIGTWDGITSTNYTTLAAAVAGGLAGKLDFELAKVRVELYDDPAPARDCYIDDVTIDGTTYSLPGDTDVVSNTGVVGDWDKVSDLVVDTGITGASDICFPDDYEDTETLFVGVVGTEGDVYLVTDTPYDLDVAGTDVTNVIGLAIAGETDEATLVAGTAGAVVYYSTDGGWDWDETDKVPSGAADALIVLSGDSVFAATSGVECALSMSVDGGALFNQISLIATDITQVVGVAFSNEYVEDETMFLLTRDTAPSPDIDSLFRYDGSNWERVADTTVLATVIAPDVVGAINMVGISPDYTTDNTVFLGDNTPQIFYTNDAGNEWDDMRYDPDFLNSWLIIDGDTIIVGGLAAGTGHVQQTTRSGSRPWEDAEEVAVAAGTVTSIAMSGDQILVGDDDSQVFISPDGELDEFEQVDTEAIGAVGDTFVAFGSDILYAASGAVVARCVVDADEDWADQEWEEIATPETTISQTVGADAFTILFDTNGQSVTIAETSGAVLVTEVSGSPTITKIAGAWKVTAGTDTDKVLVTAVGTVTPCSGSIDVAAVGTGVTLAEDTDANGNAYWPDTIAAPGIGYFVLPDVEEALEDVVTPGLQASAGIVAVPGTLYVVDNEAGVGLWRSLNPDEEDVDDVVVEVVAIELPSTATLQLAGFTAGSNVIWATDGAATTNLWTYEDTLTTAVILSSPVSGMSVSDTDEATLEWFELTGADEYQVTYDTSPDFDVDPIDEYTDDTSVTVDGLDSGTTYYWKVRVASGEPLLSPWSEVRSFFTALEPVEVPAIWVPEVGATDASLSPSFMWTGVEGATNYKIVVATDPSFAVTSRVVEVMVVTNAYACDVRLGYNTIYYWRVKAYKDSVVVSDWTTGMFTTMARPVPPTPPVEITPAPPAPPVEVEVPPPVEVIIPAAQVISPTWIYVIIGVGAVLAIAVIVLIVRTRRVT